MRPGSRAALCALAAAAAAVAAIPTAGARVSDAGTHAAAAAGEPLAYSPALRRAGLVDVRRYARSIRLDVRYATPNNFTGRRLPGYCRPWAVLRTNTARRLGRVQRRLAAHGLGLVVFDAYRPARATAAMVRWAERGNEWVLRQGWVARRSNHARGTTVDAGLVNLETGAPLWMGTEYDAFTTRSYTANASGRVLRRRLKLRDAMRTEGFANYRKEWWHFDRPVTSPRLDVPLGCPSGR